MLARRRTEIYAGYNLFLLYDPTCDEPEDLQPATLAAIAGTVGWSASAVSVKMTPDVCRFTVVVCAWGGDPGDEIGEDVSSADLTAGGSLALPSGQLCVDMALDDQSRIGWSLPEGPGTYEVRLLGLHRDEVRRRRDAAFSGGIDWAAVKALAYLEEYRFHLWRTSDTPAWDDDDDDD